MNHVKIVAFGSQNLQPVTKVLKVQTAKPAIKASNQPLRH